MPLQDVEGRVAGARQARVVDFVVHWHRGEPELIVPKRAGPENRAVRLDRHLPVQTRQRFGEARVGRRLDDIDLKARRSPDPGDELIELHFELAVDPALDMALEHAWVPATA